MGFLDSIEGMAKDALAQNQSEAGAPGAGTTASVASGLMQALEEHPGGLAGVMEHLNNSGVGEQAQNWAQTGAPTSSEQLQQGLAGSGLIESVAAKAGVSPQVAAEAMAVIMPMVISHFTQGGQTAPPQSGYAGIASQLLGRFL